MTRGAGETGIYFRREDYASFWRRAFVDLVDVAIAGAVTIGLTMLIWTMLPGADDAAVLMLVGFTAGYGYFVVLKRSRWRTPGYRLGGVQIVGLDGRTPGWGALTMRFAFAFLGPVNWALDLLFLSGDRYRQAVRDKLAHTLVIRAGAQPAGEGRVVYRYYHILFYNVLSREVAIQETGGEG